MRLGYAIAHARKAQRLNQSQVAEIAGINTSTLSLIERSKRQPRQSTVNDIAKALGVPALLLYAFAMEADERSQVPSYLLTSLDNWVAETLSLLAWEDEDDEVDTV